MIALSIEPLSILSSDYSSTVQRSKGPVYYIYIYICINIKYIYIYISQPGREKQNRQTGRDRQNRQTEREIHNGTGRTGQAERGRQNRTGKKQAEQVSQNRTGKTGLPGQDFLAPLPGQGQIG